MSFHVPIAASWIAGDGGGGTPPGGLSFTMTVDLITSTPDFVELGAIAGFNGQPSTIDPNFLADQPLSLFIASDRSFPFVQQLARIGNGLKTKYASMTVTLGSTDYTLPSTETFSGSGNFDYRVTGATASAIFGYFQANVNQVITVPVSFEGGWANGDGLWIDPVVWDNDEIWSDG